MDRYERWCNLPALLGLTLGAAAFAPQQHTSDYSPADRALASELHAFAFCAKGLALAAQDAADKMLNAGGRFLHPRTQTPAQDMLDSYARIASAAVHNRWVWTVDHSCCCVCSVLQHPCANMCFTLQRKAVMALITTHMAFESTPAHMMLLQPAVLPVIAGQTTFQH